MSKSQLTRDPVLALIKEHRDAVSAKSRARQALDRAKQKLDEVEGKDHSIFPRNRTTSSNPAYLLGHAYFLADNADIAKHVRSVIRDIPGRLGPKTAARIKRMQKAAERELRPIVRAHVAAHFKKRDDAGLTALARASAEAAEAEYRCMKKLSKARPRTAGGMSAFLKYVGPLCADGSMSFLSENVFKTIAGAVKRQPKAA